MATSDEAAVYDDLLDLLAESAEAERVLAFRLSAAKQVGRNSGQHTSGSTESTSRA